MTLKEKRQKLNAILRGVLGWGDPEYYPFIESFGVSSSTEMDSTTLDKALNAAYAKLREKNGAQQNDLPQYIQRWNDAITTRDLVVTGEDTPDQRKLRNACGWLLEIAKEKLPYATFIRRAGYAKGIIKRVTGHQRIRTAEDAETIIRMERMRARKQGAPYIPKQEPKRPPSSADSGAARKTYRLKP